MHPELYSINDIVQFFLAFCAAVITITGAAGAVYKWITKAKEPNLKLTTRIDEQDRRLDEHDKSITRIYEKLEGDRETINEIEQGSRVTQRALLAIIDQLLTGNNTDNLKQVKCHSF